MIHPFRTLRCGGERGKGGPDLSSRHLEAATFSCYNDIYYTSVPPEEWFEPDEACTVCKHPIPISVGVESFGAGQGGGLFGCCERKTLGVLEVVIVVAQPSTVVVRSYQGMGPRSSQLKGLFEEMVSSAPLLLLKSAVQRGPFSPQLLSSGEYKAGLACLSLLHRERGGWPGDIHLHSRYLLGGKREGKKDGGGHTAVGVSQSSPN